MATRGKRRLATVLFVDIVDSTTVAADVGDRQWPQLLADFRAIVRRDLKRFDGHEVDTAGDGFFAWFDGPAGAIRAAAAIVADVQKRGLDVRCGIHTGELEQIDGRLGGVGAHIGARVAGIAGPAQVLVTNTVRELAVGAEITFEAHVETELKGVPGTWTLLRVVSVDGTPLPAPLGSGEGARLRVAQEAPVIPRRRIALPATAVAAGLVVIALLYSLFGRGAAAQPSPSPTSSLLSVASPNRP